jgi:hypothetical protein
MLEDRSESDEEAIDLGHGVVVDETDPQQPAGTRKTQPLDQALRVEVAIPDRDALVAKEPPREAGLPRV